MPAGSTVGDVVEKLRRSRQRLLDLTLRNRLLNFRPGNPNYRDDLKTHKHVVLKGHIESLWESLVENEKPIEIAGLMRDQQAQLAQEMRLHSASQSGRNPTAGLSLATLVHEDWEDVRGSIRGVSQFLQKGHLLSLLPEEAFRKRLTRIRNEQNTLANSTGDSALFLAIGFLEWCEAEPHPRANEPLFAPLVLVHVSLDQKRTEEGGEREFLLHMDADQPQGNPCLVEKLRQDFAIDLPDINLDEGETADDYFSRVGRALRTKKSWKIHPTIALGFFNFARYRLWLDLNPSEWPEGGAPTNHPIVGAILNGDLLPQPVGIPGDEEVASHQESEDLPIVMDADSTQYAALLAGQKNVSMVVQGPPGSGKSQTITNLIAIALAQGKRVLFVAQKLPALQVVQRRLETVDLAPFCLPLFSDKARVTEIHKHLAASARLRETPDWRRNVNNPVVALAKKLNGHAARLRGQPTGFTQSACSLIQRAVALQLMLREAWGDEWNDELLTVSVLDVEAPPDWLEKREQSLHQWHRLKAEVGNSWSNWTPLKLGPMDTQQVEAAIRQEDRAAVALAEELALLPEGFRNLTVAKVEQLVSQVSTSRFSVLKDVLPNLLAFLWQTPDNTTAVARLERDLEEFYRQLTKAQRHLRITEDNRNYVASRATEALNAVVSVVSPRCSLASAKASLDELSGILRWAEDLSAYANLNLEGVRALWHAENQSADEAGITWKHVETLGNHRANPGLHVPTGGKPLLALHVLEDASKQNESRALARRLSRYHASVARLKSRVSDSARFQNGIVATELDESVRCLFQHSLAHVKLCELPQLEQSLRSLAGLLCDIAAKTPSGFSAAVFGNEAPAIGDFQSLASLAEVPASLLQIPANGTEKVLARLIGIPNPATALQTFCAAIQSHQDCYQESVGWFPDVQLGEAVDPAILDSQRAAAQAIRELGLQNQSLESITHLAEKVERLRKAVQTVLDVLQTHFEPWPLLRPETLDQIRQTRTLFSLLVNRPQAPAELPIEGLCLEVNTAIVSTATAESQELRLFRERHSEQVAFRDLPDDEAIAAHRRELRSLAGCWWRWFSSRYHKTRKATRSFLNPPFPSDEAALALLDELETHERRRIAFQGSPAGTLLGGLFRGIATNWQAIEPTLAWIRELQSATQMSEVTSFVQSAIRNPEALRSGVKGIEILTQLVEQDRQELAGVAPLSSLAAESRPLKLQELCAILSRTETLVKGLAERIQTQAKLHPHATFTQLASRIAQLEQLHQLAVALHEHEAIAEPVVAAKLNTAALGEDVAWLSELARRGVPPRLIDALIGGTLTTQTHSSLIHATQGFSQQCGQLSEGFLNNEAAPWLSSEVTAAALGVKLTLLTQTAVTARNQAAEWTFDNHLNVLEIRESLDDAHEIEAATRAFIPWAEILREEPSLLSAEQITTTLDWLETLRQHGAAGGLLRFILVDETDSRLHWWQELVSRAKDLRSRVRKLQDSFALPLHDTQPAMTLLAWSSQTADRSAKTTSALEVVESHSQSTDFTVHDLAQATAGLLRALELQTTLQSWRERLGADATRLDVARIQNHRRWAAVTHGLPPAIELWLTTSDTTSRCEVLLGIDAKLTALKKTIKQAQDSLGFFGRLSGDGPFAVFSTSGTPREIEQHCCAFTAKISLLPHYAALLREREAAKKLGLTNLLKHAETAKVSTEVLIQTFRGAVAHQQAKAIWESDDELRYFQSNEHERLRQKFQEDDDKQLKTNRRFIQKHLSKMDVTPGHTGRTAGEYTEYALIQREIGKKGKHWPVRKLVQHAGRAMQDLCPCWMMTPLAVAQFLAPGAITFDLVIMDEASQINPEDAWGTIARGKQLVVVGDQKQMPPSDFFMSALEEDESPEEEAEIDGGKSESILDASVASLLSSPLLWHYRSRQETLIAPANSFSYDNRLILFPHAHRGHPELGIRYTYIGSATTTTGKVINALEADAVAKRVRELVLREYAKPPKDRLTIGVVTMNLYQQDAVMDLLEKSRQDDRRFDLAMTALASEQNEEPLFVRNLENIQGDERDIMILSCTYGPHTPGGTPTQRFGPLNREGGERRFNVLITRAKWRMEIFSSIRSEQILVDGKRQGVRDFHLFLKYAETGVLIERGETTGKQSDSPFEVQVEAVLCRAGFQTERQVGVAGYFIDLGVKHPHHTGLFALGIECDGRTYHSSRAARDRDRLREKVIIERGCKLHRIWSTDWFVNPQQAKKRLIEAVNAACR